MSAAGRLQLYSVQNTNSFYMHHENTLKKCYLKGVHGLREGIEAVREGKKIPMEQSVHCRQTTGEQKKGWALCLPAGVWDFQPGLYHK